MVFHARKGFFFAMAVLLLRLYGFPI